MDPEVKPRPVEATEVDSQTAKLFLDPGASAQKRFHEDPSACQGILKHVQTKYRLVVKESLIPSAGSGLFVEDAIREGEEVFQAQPFVNCRAPELVDVCDYCLISRNAKLNIEQEVFDDPHKVVAFAKCQGCKHAHYCSRKCQKQAWAAYHKEECKLLKESPGISPLILMLFRILLWDKAGKISSGYWNILMMLEDCFDQRSEETDDDSFQLAVEAGRRNISHRNITIIWKLYYALMTNAMNIRVADDHASYGMSFDLAISVINHSCDPNTFVFFEGNRLHVRSLKPIAAGSEITIAYCNTSLGIHSRQAMLQTAHYIACSCNRCIGQLKEHERIGRTSGSSPENLYAAQKELGKMGEDMQETFKARPSEQGRKAVLGNFVAQLKGVMKKGHPQGAWPDSLEPLPDLRLSLAMCYGELHQLGAAVMYGLKGCLLSEDRHMGPDWVHTFLDLVAILAEIGQAALDDQLFKIKGFPQRVEIQVIAAGYMLYVLVAMTKTYGAGCRFVQVYLHFITNFFAIPGLPEPTEKMFAELFEVSQEKLLRWAGVDVTKAVVMPDAQTVKCLLEADVAGDLSTLSIED